MGKPYSLDLRERVVGAVLKEGLSRNQAAGRFGVGISTAINWVRRFQETGSVAAGRMGGHKPKAIRGEYEVFVRQRLSEGNFTLRGLVGELAERGLKVDYRSVWNFVHAEKLSFKKKPCTPASRIVLTLRVVGRSGESIRAGSTPSAWSSSMRPGPEPIWRLSEAGPLAAKGSRPRFPMDAGTP